uniref:E3 ubiquitin-protein ligase ARIH2-like n=1 Tax=Gasterosteus aculeatus aculeatus TaxID=481459 RepID=UPI001A97EFCA|nr:E3 ubiquitin-protein ligase ARIH2-like [Gasterosteus aculeatus aculeatus]
MGNKLSAGRKRQKTRVSPGREKRYDSNDVSLNFVDADDVLDFLCEDYASLRATMSCGHAVTPMSLTAWCRRQLDEGGYKFVCGQTDCDVEWPFEEVQKMALLTPEEIEEFDQKIFQNVASNFLDIKCCPGCSSRVARTDRCDQNVECKVCTAKQRRTFTFCWRCLREWNAAAPSKDCGNGDCQDPLEILESCPDITFEVVQGVTGCPSIRACPTCGLLVRHDKTRCKNVVCLRCKVEFCFACLKRTSECADKDGSYYARCYSGVAPRQRDIPVWKMT